LFGNRESKASCKRGSEGKVDIDFCLADKEG